MRVSLVSVANRNIKLESVDELGAIPWVVDSRHPRDSSDLRKSCPDESCHYVKLPHGILSTGHEHPHDCENHSAGPWYWVKQTNIYTPIQTILHLLTPTGIKIFSDFSVKSAFCRTYFLVSTEENQRRCAANSPLDWKYE